MDEDRSNFDELGDELRQSVGGEFRRTAEEDEYAAAKAQLRARTLEHVAYELLSRGDTVAVTIGAEIVQGIVVHAKGDLLCVETPAGDRCDVRLGTPASIHVVQRATSPGRARDRFGAESFVARLRELELDEVPVTVIGPMRRDPVVGTIAAVASDHVLLRNDDGDWYLPLAGIAAVSMR